MTRAQASEAMEYVSESRIEKIESETLNPQPDDVVAMAKAYKKPEFCNYYCSNQCAIGKEQIPEVKVSSLSEVVLRLLSSLNTLDRQKDRLIDITADGRIDEKYLRLKLLILRYALFKLIYLFYGLIKNALHSRNMLWYFFAGQTILKLFLIKLTITLIHGSILKSEHEHFNNKATCCLT